MYTLLQIISPVDTQSAHRPINSCSSRGRGGSGHNDEHWFYNNRSTFRNTNYSVALDDTSTEGLKSDREAFSLPHLPLGPYTSIRTRQDRWLALSVHISSQQEKRQRALIKQPSLRIDTMDLTITIILWGIKWKRAGWKIWEGRKLHGLIENISQRAGRRLIKPQDEAKKNLSWLLSRIHMKYNHFAPESRHCWQQHTHQCIINTHPTLSASCLISED